MIVFVLTENEPSEGGEPVGAYSTVEKARRAAAERPPQLAGFFFYKIYPIEIDDPASDGIDSVAI